MKNRVVFARLQEKDAVRFWRRVSARTSLASRAEVFGRNARQKKNIAGY